MVCDYNALTKGAQSLEAKPETGSVVYYCQDRVSINVSSPTIERLSVSIL